MRSPKAAISSAAFVALAGAAVALRAQTAPPPPASGGSAALSSAPAEPPNPMARARTARSLLRNGLDYIEYGEYDRALALLREAEARQSELLATEKQSLQQGILKARQGLRAAETAPQVARGRAVRPGLGRRSGTVVVAQTPPPASAVAVRAVPIPDLPPEPIQLTSAETTEPPAAGTEGPASPPTAGPVPVVTPPTLAPAPDGPAPLVSGPPALSEPPPPIVAAEAQAAPRDEVAQVAAPPELGASSPSEPPALEAAAPPPALVLEPFPTAEPAAPSALAPPAAVPGPEVEEKALETVAPATGAPTTEPIRTSPEPAPPALEQDAPATPAVANSQPVVEGPPTLAVETIDPLAPDIKSAPPAPRPPGPRTASVLDELPPLPADSDARAVPVAELEPSEPVMPPLPEAPAARAVPVAELEPSEPVMPPLPEAPAARSVPVAELEPSEPVMPPLPTATVIEPAPGEGTEAVSATASETASAPEAPAPEVVPMPDQPSEIAPPQPLVESEAPVPDEVSLGPVLPPLPPERAGTGSGGAAVLRLAASSRPEDDALPADLRREVEEIARVYQEELQRDFGPRTGLGAGPTPPYTGMGENFQNESRIELPRPPSPTESRPIRSIPVPEEFVPLAPREWTPSRKVWAAVGTCHTPLYFQDAPLERYGLGLDQAVGPHWGRFTSFPLDDPTQSNQRQQIFQPIWSVAKFSTQIVLWPINMVMNPPWEAEYDLGYWRPGDRVPPDMLYWPLRGYGPPLRGSRY